MLPDTAFSRKGISIVIATEIVSARMIALAPIFGHEAKRGLPDFLFPTFSCFDFCL